MDLCGPMRVKSINGKKYILVIVEDYSWFTWVKFLRSKDEALEFIIKQKQLLQLVAPQNHSLIRLRHGKTPYELLHDRKPDLSYLHAFGTICYPTNDSEDLGKLKAKANVVLEVAAPEPAVSTGTPSSTLVNQDAPSPSTSQTPSESPSHVIPPGVEEADHDIEVAHMDNVCFPILEPSSKESSS
ncbi:retrovirus-related pol polyprotein from transposon TNT 1-94 [Tanacetum coccineum]